MKLRDKTVLIFDYTDVNFIQNWEKMSLQDLEYYFSIGLSVYIIKVNFFIE